MKIKFYNLHYNYIKRTLLTHFNDIKLHVHAYNLSPSNRNFKTFTKFEILKYFLWYSMNFFPLKHFFNDLFLI